MERFTKKFHKDLYPTRISSTAYLHSLEDGQLSETPLIDWSLPTPKRMGSTATKIKLILMALRAE